MSKKSLYAVLFGLGVLVAPTSEATVITPDSIVRPPPANSPPFGTLDANGLVTNQYNAFGLMFGPDRVGIFSDPPNAWAGVNASDVVDLISPVVGYFVMPSSAINAVTDLLSVEIGFADVGNLLLEAFDINGLLLASTLNDDGVGPNGRSLATLNMAGIHSFRVSGSDSWGMNQIEFGNLSPTGAVPEPATLALLGLGLAGLGFMRRKA